MTKAFEHSAPSFFSGTDRTILVVCTAAFLSGCGTLGKSNETRLTEEEHATKGKTLEQLVAKKRADQTIYWKFNMIAGMDYYCYRCDGQPTRTYTNRAGNTVAVYFYRSYADYPVECYKGSAGEMDCDHGNYSQCNLLEQRYEFKDGVVLNVNVLNAFGNRMPLHSKACDGYDHILPKTD
ncbi:MAG: hypothetical protein LBE62_08195 [Azonexus sp.]|nr:hypothetical protein [Azonexus sp.]